MMRRWGPRSLLAGAFLVAVMLIVSHTRQWGLLKLLVPTLWELEPVSATVFVEPAMPLKRRQQLLVDGFEAALLQKEFWSQVLTQPYLVACSSDDCFRAFGGRGGRGLHFARSILLGPTGLSKTIITHEWTHAELAARVGWLSDVPAWFNEGLAVVVSADERYSEAAYSVIEARGEAGLNVRTLDSLERFLETDHAYLLAAHEVRRWLGVVGRVGLARAINYVAAGRSFVDSYQAAEREAVMSAASLP